MSSGNFVIRLKEWSKDQTLFMKKYATIITFTIVIILSCSSMFLHYITIKLDNRILTTEKRVNQLEKKLFNLEKDYCTKKNL